MSNLFRLWSKWDLGFEGLIFKTKELAKEYAKKAYEENGSFDLIEEPFEEAWGDYIGIGVLEVVK